MMCYFWLTFCGGLRNADTWDAARYVPGVLRSTARDYRTLFVNVHRNIGRVEDGLRTLSETRGTLRIILRRYAA